MSTRADRLAMHPTAVTPTVAERVDALYSKHHRRVYATALNYAAGNHAWAEDITQDVFFTLLERLPSLPPRGDLGPWLRRVTINRCISAYRRRKIRQAPILRWMLSSTPDEAQPELDLDVSDALRRVWQAVEQLPAKQRAVFCLHHLDGESQTTVARTLGHSDGYVSKLLRRAEASVRAHVGSKVWDHG